MTKRQSITFTDDNFSAEIEITKNEALTRQIVKMCKTLDDVQRCASMGDFRIICYDIVNRA